MEALSYGRHFIILIDQKSLKFLNEQHMLTEEQFKWVSKLLGYDFEIQFRPKKENQVADALSRREYFMAVSLFQKDEWETWETEVQQDEKLNSSGVTYWSTMTLMKAMN